MNRLAEGKIDVLIRTHRILNPDVEFHDLGLLIDEEQRFGVAQKTRRIGCSVKWPPGQKRLQAIRDFTELGAGFKIAMRDLEIRGA